MLFLILVLIFVFSYAGTFIIRSIAIKKQIIDIPNSRSSHSLPTPRGGGVIIALTWFLGISVLYFLGKIPVNLFAALLCGIPVSIMGLVDDIVTVSPRVRLIGQLLCTSLAIFFLGGLESIDLGFTILHSAVLFNIIAVIGIIWLINLFNFLDGIDGYISTEIIFICLTAYFLLGTELPLLLVAATAGFLIWNWQPAKIFMGDVGSTLIGFTTGVFAVYYQDINQSSIIVWLMLTSLFWFDATLTLFRRWRNHEMLSIAHRKHAYQRVVQSGFSHQKTVLFSLLVNLPVIGLVWFSIKYPLMLLPLFCINLVYLFIVMHIVDKRLPFSKI
jgi:UDP-N-acetylmuramyl pentapeptide phosphotransferase/UDP-N-acetylglucosamine-1-phosphate transferase